MYCPYLSPDFGLIPAGFQRRLIAGIIDFVLVVFAGFVIGLVASPLLLAVPDRLEEVLAGRNLQLMAAIGYLVVGWIYFAGFESSEGQSTIGKNLTGIMVCDLAGEPISFWRASLRYLAKLLSILTLGVGFLMMLRHPRRQALHDRIAHTLVIVNLNSQIVEPS